MLPVPLRDAGFVLAVACAITAAAHAQSDDVERRLDAPLKLLHRLRPSEGARQAVAMREPAQADMLRRLRGVASQARDPLLMLIVRHTGDPQRLEEAGFRIQARVGEIYTGTIALGGLEKLAAVPGVRFVQTSRKAFAQQTGSSGVMAMHPAVDADPPPLYSGAGVLVAWIDTGADVFHHDFRRSDGSTRIKYLLDFSSPGDADGNGTLDGTGPFGGTLYTEAQINGALASPGGFAELDSTGHGTHGLSIAAGDDSAFPGVAPAADLIVVKATRVDGSLAFETADVVNALAFVDQKAAELARPYVVNLSLGTIVSSHDGRSLEEQAIDTLFGSGHPGKAAVVAAGNSSENGTTRFHHIGGTSYVGMSQAHTLTIPAYAPAPGQGNDRAFIDLWYRGRDKHRVTVTPPGGSPVFAAFGAYADVPTPQGNVFISNLGGANPENGDVEAIVVIDDWQGTPPVAGAWTITITCEEAGDNGEYHAWLGDESTVGATHPYFSDNADNEYLVGKPGTAFNAITVGSYARHDATTRFRTSWTDVNGAARTDSTAADGALSDFSSTGMTRDGRLKPDLTAPGERVLGAVSKDAWPGIAPGSAYRFHPFSDPEALVTDRTANRAFGLLQGTSFAAPVVTGLVARILSQDPTLDAIQIRNVLLNAAISDAFTGAVPNDRWGWGKASMTIGTTTTLPSNVFITTLSLPPTRPGAAYSQVLAASGGALPYAWSLNGGSLPPGLTLSASGLISGSATTIGSYSFTVKASDASNPARSTTRAFTIAVSATTPLGVTTSVLPPAHLATIYDAAVEASGGIPPYAWSLAGGALPPGLTLGSNGHVTGTTSVLGRYNFTVRVQDSASAVALRSVRIKVTRDGAQMWDPMGDTWTNVDRVAVDPTDSNHVVTFTTNALDDALNVVMESNDLGESWHAISINNGFAGHPDFEVTAMMFQPSGVAWAARGIGVAGQGVVMRYDEVASRWITAGDCGDSAALDFDDNGTVYLVCSSSMQFRKSTDQGQTWTSVGTLCGADTIYGGGVLAYLSVSRSNPSHMYVTRKSWAGWQSCHSSDGGVTWALDDTATSAYHSIHVSRTNPLDVIRGGTNDRVIDRSVDGGSTWTRINTPTYYSLLDRSPSDPASLLIFGGIADFYRSANNGQTWTLLTVQGLPFTERIRAIAFDPNDANAFYIGTTIGLFYTSDGGATWTAKNRNLLLHPTSGIAISAGRPDDLILTTSASGAYLSRTGGQKWTLVQNMHLVHLESPKTSTTDPNLFYMRDDLPIRSIDRGMTWQTLYPCEPDCPSAIFGIYFDAFDNDPAGNTLLLADGKADIYRSANRGDTWTKVGTMSTFGARVVDFSFAYDHPNRVYAGVESALDGVYRSEDGGVTWAPYGDRPGPNRIFPAPSNSNYLYSNWSLRYFDPAVGSWQLPVTAPSGTIKTITVDWHSHLIAYAGIAHPGTPGTTGGIYKTTDGGRHWSRIASVLDTYSVLSIAVHPTNPDSLYVATAEDGIFYTIDGGATWAPLDRFGTVGEVVNLAVKHPQASNVLFAATAGYGVQVSNDDGATFSASITGLTNLNVNAIAFDPGTSTTMYAGTDAGVFKSTNTGTSWAPAGAISGIVTDLATDNDGSGTRRIWATVKGQGVALSENGGNTFTIYSAGLGSLDLTSIEVQTGVGTRRIWATTRGADGVVYSDDDGRTWRSAAGSGLANREVTDLTIDSGTGTRRIWATTSSGVFYSDNDGLSWKELSLGLPAGIEVSSVSIDPNTREALVSLNSDRDGGVYRGANITGSWSPFNEGLDELKVLRLTNDRGRMVDATTAATTFYAGTAGDGAYKSELRTSTAPPLTITTSLLPAATLREPYSATLAASGGIPPYTWSIAVGFLPAGLSLHASTATIAGTLARIESAPFAVRVADSSSHVAQRTLSIPTGYAPFSITFTDDPLIAGVTQIKAIHLLELRAAVDALRERAGLATTTFSDPLVSPLIAVRAIHLLELRSALDEARRILGLAPISWTAGLAPGSAGRAVHAQELRNGTR